MRRGAFYNLALQIPISIFTLANRSLLFVSGHPGPTVLAPEFLALDHEDWQKGRGLFRRR